MENDEGPYDTVRYATLVPGQDIFGIGHVEYRESYVPALNITFRVQTPELPLVIWRGRRSEREIFDLQPGRTLSHEDGQALTAALAVTEQARAARMDMTRRLMLYPVKF